MARHCISVRLTDGTVVSLQFSKLPTEAEIERAKAGMEKDIELLKAGLPPAKPEEEYP